MAHLKIERVLEAVAESMDSANESPDGRNLPLSATVLLVV